MLIATDYFSDKLKLIFIKEYDLFKLTTYKMNI